MTVHRDKFLVNETNRRNELQFLLVLRLYMFRAAFLHNHQEFLAVHRHWYIIADLMTVCYQEHKMYQCRCTAKNS